MLSHSTKKQNQTPFSHLCIENSISNTVQLHYAQKGATERSVFHTDNHGQME